MTIDKWLALGQTAAELGLVNALTVLSLFLSYSMLNVCDLSTDGCYTLGAAVGALVAVKAAMIDERILNDPYVRNSIYQLIRKRINDAKVGVLKVHGNYSIVGGDPYALCQSIFGMKITGLLDAGEIYNRYWSERGAEELLCFRAPMSVHNNIRRVRLSVSEDAAYWYRYNTTATFFNAWDSATAALNG